MVTRADVLHVAALARLELTPDEVKRMTEQLASILEHVDALQRAHIEETDNGDEGAVRLADDAPGPDPLLRPIDALAPAWQDGFFTVPRLSALGRGEADEGG